MSDILTENDITKLVDQFYSKVNKDELLSPVFNEVAKIDWEHHLPIMYSFWRTLLLGKMDYKGQPFPKHAVLPIQKEHFERWISLFLKTVDENFQGDKAEEAKLRAQSIAHIFQSKMGLVKRL